MSEKERLKAENRLLRNIIEATIRQLKRERQKAFVYGHVVDSLVNKIEDSMKVINERQIIK